jgi:hypothetical protein
MMRMTRSMIVNMAITGAAAAALLCFDAPPSRAQYFGDAPWCAVVAIGTGGVHWDCEYNTVEACVPNVIAGNRGFCGMNPYYRSGYQAGEWQGSPAPHDLHHPYVHHPYVRHPYVRHPYVHHPYAQHHPQHQTHSHPRKH